MSVFIPDLQPVSNVSPSGYCIIIICTFLMSITGLLTYLCPFLLILLFMFKYSLFWYHFKMSLLILCTFTSSSLHECRSEVQLQDCRMEFGRSFSPNYNFFRLPMQKRHWSSCDLILPFCWPYILGNLSKGRTRVWFSWEHSLLWQYLPQNATWSGRYAFSFK